MATYDSSFNLVSATGPTGLTTSYTYSNAGELTSATNPLGQTTTYTYGGSDNLITSATNPQADSTSYNYDGNGNLTSVLAPDGTSENMAYDALGDVLSLTDPNGQVTSYTYNAAGQVSGITLQGGSAMTYTYDPQGNLITATDGTGVTRLTYDTGDRLLSVTYPNGQSLTYTYDTVGRRSQMVVKQGSSVTHTVIYTYNTLGQLTKLTDGSNNLIVSYTYNNVGELAREDNADGTYSTDAYDPDGHLLALVNYAANGSIDSSFTYTYNALGQVTTLATKDGTWTYSYDNASELVHAALSSTNPGIPSQNLSYTYNAAGNLTQTIVNGTTTSYTSNSVDEYTTAGGTAYGYNANGDLVSATNASSTTTYTYDSLNRLLSVTSPTDSWVYEYDSLGNRTATIHNGQTTTNLVDPNGVGDVIGQYNGAGNLIASYTYGLGLLSQTTASTTNYYQFDGDGSTVGLTNAGSGLVNSYSYLPSGSLLSSTGTAANPFTYLGQFGVTTDGSGLFDMRARSFNPATGQFTTGDPLGQSGSGTNLRAYAGNDPVENGDPIGLYYLTLNVPTGLPGIGGSAGIQVGTDANGNFGIYPYYGGYAGANGAGASVTGSWGNVTPGWSSVASLQFVVPTVLGPYTVNPLHPLIPGNPATQIGLGIGLGSAINHTVTGHSIISTILTGAAHSIYSRLGAFGSNPGYVPPPPVSITVHWTTNTFTSSPCSPSSSSSGGSSASTAGSIDPNSLLGPSGFGPSNFVSGAAKALPLRDRIREFAFRNRSCAAGVDHQRARSQSRFEHIPVNRDRLRRHRADDSSGQSELSDDRTDDRQWSQLRRGREREPGLCDAAIDGDVPVDRSKNAVASRHSGRVPASRERHRPRAGIYQLPGRPQGWPADRYEDRERRQHHFRQQSTDRHRSGQRDRSGPGNLDGQAGAGHD